MSPDKTLHKIQVQLNDLLPKLELFVEPTVQPSANECDQLLTQLSALQENLVIYRFLRQHNEISPALNMHAKISEAVAIKEIATETLTLQSAAAPIAEPVSEPKPPASTEPPPATGSLAQQAPEPPKQAAPEATTAATGKAISVGINDKFRFINSLFAQNAAEYTIAVEQLNSVTSWNDAEIYLNSLRNLYSWKEDSDITKLFYSLVKKRFV